MTRLSDSVPLCMNEEGGCVFGTSVVFYCGQCLLTVSSNDLLEGKWFFFSFRPENVIQ